MSSVLLVLMLLAVPGARPADWAERAVPTRDPGPVLVELFTSQGCSSCPPADRLLRELAGEEDIIALSFHVDYWNYIGWTDPFSSAEWSKRQRSYAKSFKNGRIYTPQIVVDGRFEGVGSNRREVAKLLERARTSGAKTQLSLEAEWLSSVDLHVSLTVGMLSGMSELDAWLAVVEDDLVTPVSRGENASKTLENDRVVRRLVKLPGLTHAHREDGETSIQLATDPAWDRENLSIVAFLQQPASLEVGAAAELPSSHWDVGSADR